MWRLLMAIAAFLCWRRYQRARRQGQCQALQALVLELLYEHRRREWQREADEDHVEDVRMAHYDLL